MLKIDPVAFESARLSLGLSRYSVADRIGRSFVIVNDIERGKSGQMTLDMAGRACRALGTDWRLMLTDSSEGDSDLDSAADPEEHSDAEDARVLEAVMFQAHKEIRIRTIMEVLDWPEERVAAAGSALTSQLAGRGIRLMRYGRLWNLRPDAPVTLDGRWIAEVDHRVHLTENLGGHHARLLYDAWKGAERHQRQLGFAATDVSGRRAALGMLIHSGLVVPSNLSKGHHRPTDAVYDGLAPISHLAKPKVVSSDGRRRPSDTTRKLNQRREARTKALLRAKHSETGTQLSLRY